MELDKIINRDPKTLSRIYNGETESNQDTLILICFGLHLPLVISDKLLEVFGCPLNPVKYPDYRWIKEALFMKYPESMWVIRNYLVPYGITL